MNLWRAGAVCALVVVLTACGKDGDKSAAQPVAGETAAVFAANFADLAGKSQPMKQWQGKVVVLNFWAPWCPPCREEIPGFMRLHERYKDKGVVFVGLALDQKQNVEAFVDEVGVSYPVLLGEAQGMELSSLTGNRLGGLPYTVVIDRAGAIVDSKVGAWEEAKLDAVLRPLL